MWADFHGAREVLAFCATVAMLAVEAETGAPAGPALAPLLDMLADLRAPAKFASAPWLAMVAEAGAPAGPALAPLLAMLADLRAPAQFALAPLLAVLAAAGAATIPNLAHLAVLTDARAMACLASVTCLHVFANA